MRDRTLDAGVTEIPESQLQEYISTREALAWIREQENLVDDASRADEATLADLRAFADETMDFDIAEAERQRDWSLAEEYAMDAETSSPSGSCYFLNGAVVDADVPHYDPDTVVEDPRTTFADYS